MVKYVSANVKCGKDVQYKMFAKFSNQNKKKKNQSQDKIIVVVVMAKREDMLVYIIAHVMYTLLL